MKKRKQVSTKDTLIGHSIRTKSQRSYERHTRNIDGDIVRRSVTEPVNVQLQEWNGSIFHNGAKIS